MCPEQVGSRRGGMAVCSSHWESALRLGGITRTAQCSVLHKDMKVVCYCITVFLYYSTSIVFYDCSTV